MGYLSNIYLSTYINDTLLVQGSPNDIPTVASEDDYGSSGQRNIGDEKIQLTPIQVNSKIN